MDILSDLNLIFTTMFTVECVLKLASFGPKVLQPHPKFLHDNSFTKYFFFVQKIRQILRKSTGTEQDLLFSLHKHGSYFACFALLATNYPGRHDTMINQGYIFRILINRNKTKPTILWNI